MLSWAGGSRRLNQNKKKRDIQIRRDMPISQNKLMPYSDNPSMIEEPAREHRRNPGTSTRKNRPSSRFKLGKFFQKWIMSSRHLKIPGQQQHVNLHDSARLPIKIRPVSFLYTHFDQYHTIGDRWIQPDEPFNYSYS
ncbi:hypothetical protein PGTUg99_031810 [Puccinia graminis f. sp. tritici]|uniref:Uncharacterized protein n=1 Tax=Puccinia graminis f. sp. tritici TaxID=56615 RepID=A0A5B0S8U3_PUCGR|nr:hypothetical protein PGTUg99_031810 [Puccinia graminis f. sp. tritici]